MASNKTEKPQPVHIRHPRSPGGGWELRDLIKLPVWLLVVIRVFQLLWKYSLASLLTLTAILFLAITSFDLGAACLGIVLALTLYLLYQMSKAALRYEYGRTIPRLGIAIIRQWWLRKHLDDFYLACEIKRQPLPRIRKIRFNPVGCTFQIKTSKTGKTSLDIAIQAQEIAAALDAYEVSVDTPRPALAKINVSWGDPTEKIVRPGDVPAIEPGRFVPFATDTTQHAVTLAIYLSILIVGRSGSGKSNIVWEFINKLNTYRIPYRLRVIDPKGGVELTDLQDSPYCVDYVSNTADVQDLIDRAHEDMMDRFKYMKINKIRNLVEPTRELPVDILIVDEMLNLKQYGPDSKFGLRLSQGRSCLTITLAMSQLSQIDTIGRVRDLFAQRVCMGVESSEVTDATLGHNAEKRGAKSSEIPITSPGVGFVYRDGHKGFTKFRVPLINDDETLAIAHGTPITSETAGRFRSIAQIGDSMKRKIRVPTAVYMLYNSMGRLLYVGITTDVRRRFSQHSKDKTWWRNVDMSLTEITWYKTRKAAKKQESRLIKSERPVHNKAENKYYDPNSEEVKNDA